MGASQRIYKVRRRYNKWVADQTLEDYALRFTARSGRTMSIERVAMTALGATAFLALESIAAAVTLTYGFTNTLIAMLVVCTLLFITGFPIVYHAARNGLDIDLLTRGAGFGYLGSTITSLVYASFTFIFFAIEAAILAAALRALFGIPLALGYLLSALAVIPIVTHGIKAISRFQLGTQPLWLLLQVSALAVVIVHESAQYEHWTGFVPEGLDGGGQFNLMLFGAAASVFFAMVAQIGEQVDYLRFMPEKTTENRRRWWFWLVLAGPGWVFIGMIKMLLGSFLAYIALSEGAGFAVATDPTLMYQRVFGYLTHSDGLALLLAGVMVIVSQMKINVTNAYAGSIAWSNFFSRLTHSHPGRVVWLVFNVTIALILMELGIYEALEAILGVFAIVAVSWLGSLSAELLINKPLGLSPPGIEFKRAHLYDVNPVGVGSMMMAVLVGMLAYLGVLGDEAQTLSHFISLGCCFVMMPLLAWLTGGRFYLARPTGELTLLEVDSAHDQQRCGVCENRFETEDLSYCPAYDLPICSLCCSLDARCLDSCKPHARFSQQVVDFLRLFFPQSLVNRINSRLGRFVGLLLSINLLLAGLLAVVYRHMHPGTAEGSALLGQTLWALFFVLLIVSGVMAWLFLLAHESRVVAQQESNRQTRKLLQEIEAHKETDRALQAAKELAERASEAKSRYMSGISHELRTPLQSIIGYAQLMQGRDSLERSDHEGLKIIHRSGEYLADLIEGLLDISRIEAGRLELCRGAVALPELITQLEQMFSFQAAQKRVKFICELPERLPAVVMTDEKRLRQILINLLSNAVKYTLEGEVHFRIRYRNQVAEFCIEDTGIGINTADLERIFDPFERVRTADTPNLPGTGLGLTIVKLLTEIMGGDLQVESTPGQGSRFRVSLMLPWADGAQVRTDVQQPIIGYAGNERQICIVDDDPVLRGLLSDLLMPLGFRILEARDAQACLELVAQTQPDLFLLDISMPGMDGLTLAGELRRSGHRAPILMLSADVQEQRRQPVGEAIYDEYLVKPISNHLLVERVGHYLNLDWERQPPRSAPTDAVIAAPVAVVTDANAPRDPLPAHPLLRELKGCAEIGYRRGVCDVMQRLEQAEVVTGEVMAHLQALTDGMQFSQLAEYLERQT
ncbi:signal transduction histidine kinase [Marinobacterium halophilum]|uniref:histidine kinase n=1 Tax=Marinobacterium halophilum TaxID=267374 RepID=A0A2P8F4L8_9GAMM|nr:ATP-binding protein [Marinobacterium halophilum]PSL16654.1 signal transduction histidine kinase [Marinobacterium halophilum]